MNRVPLAIAQCTVDYVAGRLTAHLPSARRLLLVKADGSCRCTPTVALEVVVRRHEPVVGGSASGLLARVPVWVVENKAGEQLDITIEEIGVIIF